MRGRCINCLNRSQYSEYKQGRNHSFGEFAECYVFGHEVIKDCAGCEFFTDDPKQARKASDKPSKPLFDVGSGWVDRIHKHEFPFKWGECMIRTIEYFGRWYAGCDFSIKCDRGAHCYPNIYFKSYNTEREAIEAKIKDLIRFSEGCTDEEKVIECLKGFIQEQRQLTLF